MILEYENSKNLVFITCSEVTSDCNDVNEVWSVPTSVWSLETLVSKAVTLVSKVLTEVLRVVTSDSSVVILAPYRKSKCLFLNDNVSPVIIEHILFILSINILPEILLLLLKQKLNSLRTRLLNLKLKCLEYSKIFDIWFM